MKTYVRVTKKSLGVCNITDDSDQAVVYRQVDVCQCDGDIEDYTKIVDDYSTIKELRLPLYAMDFINAIGSKESTFIIVDDCLWRTENEDDCDFKSFDGSEYYTVAYEVLDMLYNTFGAVFIDLRIIGDTSETGVGFSDREWLAENYARILNIMDPRITPAMIGDGEGHYLMGMLDDEHREMINDYIREYNAE